MKAARRGILPRVTRRLNELERRSMIRSGAVFVFSVEESGIKCWTEGLAWSQSRISGNFLVSALCTICQALFSCVLNSSLITIPILGL